ncbi:hypothetical protein [Janthinobacterium psychrotolerans]|uniref:Lipoprotein n=1 Tax=Janthinobacterium psychrotolerans TaxID=1747903 RepID=A0A1A7C3V3_9BURK|nr:hypothetical protein [Janthinobacterium psychrotolerans]OBV40631.1 hypothetical protein ASR47_101821 [Janthinobacterium psychrotolerans]
MRRPLAAMLLLSGLAGCATMTGSTEQMVLVQTILDNRQLAGAGCILSNDMGKWFVTTPGRIMIRKSREPLKVDCKKSGSPAVVMDDSFDATVNGGSAWSNVIFTLGVGYFVDRDTGAAYDYPSTLTVIMQDPARLARPAPAPAALAAPAMATPPAAQPSAVVMPPAAPAAKPVLSPVPDPVVY